MRPRLHFWVGVLGLLAFLGTGHYMDHVHHHLADMPDGRRMLFRSTHIYILLASVTNLGMSYCHPRLRGATPIAAESNSPAERFFRALVSGIVLSAPLLFLLGFMTEPFGESLTRGWSRLSAYLLFGTAVFIVLEALYSRVSRLWRS